MPKNNKNASSGKKLADPALPGDVPFQAQQLSNLMENYRRVDAVAEKLVIEAQELRERLAALEAERQEQAEEASRLRAENETLSKHCASLSQEIAAIYDCAVRMARPFQVAATIDLPEQVVGSFARIGMTGLVEKIELSEGQIVCAGWATKHMTSHAKLLVSIHDSLGCIGYGVPSHRRDDVFRVVPDSELNCGFSFPLLRRPVESVVCFLNVFNGSDNTSFSIRLPALGVK